MQVSVYEAGMDFPKLIHMLESRREEAIIVSRSGKPVAKITLYDENQASCRIGIAKGKFKSPIDLDVDNDEIADMLTGGAI